MDKNGELVEILEDGDYVLKSLFEKVLSGKLDVEEWKMFWEKYPSLDVSHSLKDVLTFSAQAVLWKNKDINCRKIIDVLFLHPDFGVTLEAGLLLLDWYPGIYPYFINKLDESYQFRKWWFSEKVLILFLQKISRYPDFISFALLTLLGIEKVYQSEEMFECLLKLDNRLDYWNRKRCVKIVQNLLQKTNKLSFKIVWCLNEMRRLYGSIVCHWIIDYVSKNVHAKLGWGFFGDFVQDVMKQKSFSDKLKLQILAKFIKKAQTEEEYNTLCRHLTSLSKSPTKKNMAYVRLILHKIPLENVAFNSAWNLWLSYGEDCVKWEDYAPGSGLYALTDLMLEKASFADKMENVNSNVLLSLLLHYIRYGDEKGKQRARDIFSQVSLYQAKLNWGMFSCLIEDIDFDELSTQYFMRIAVVMMEMGFVHPDVLQRWTDRKGITSI